MSRLPAYADLYPRVIEWKDGFAGLFASMTRSASCRGPIATRFWSRRPMGWKQLGRPLPPTPCNRGHDPVAMSVNDCSAPARSLLFLIMSP